MPKLLTQRAYLIYFITLLALSPTVLNSIQIYHDPVWGGFDLHSYWFYGHFTWESINPYRAFARLLSLEFPIHYWDGVIVTDSLLTQETLGDVPANTAPIVLLMSLLSRFSWDVARLLWIGINLVLIFITPVLTLQLLPKTEKSDWRLLVGVALVAYMGWYVKAGVLYGQTTFLIVVCLLLALNWREKSWLLAGLFLGVALSKYSLAIGVVLFFLLERRWRTLIVAGFVQLAGIVALTSLDGSSIVDTIRVYLYLASLHVDDGGIHLASIVEGLPLTIVSGVGLTLVVGVIIGRKYPSFQDPQHKLHILAVLVLWSLLAVYHLNYDMFALVIPAAVLLYGLTQRVWRLSPRQYQLLWLITFGMLLTLILPDAFVPIPKWGVLNKMPFILGFLVLLSGLMYRLPNTMRPS